MNEVDLLEWILTLDARSFLCGIVVGATGVISVYVTRSLRGGRRW